MFEPWPGALCCVLSCSRNELWLLCALNASWFQECSCVWKGKSTALKKYGKGLELFRNPKQTWVIMYIRIQLYSTQGTL